jgi:hypothetical protein
VRVRRGALAGHLLNVSSTVRTWPRDIRSTTSMIAMWSTPLTPRLWSTYSPPLQTGRLHVRCRLKTICSRSLREGEWRLPLEPAIHLAPRRLTAVPSKLPQIRLRRQSDCRGLANRVVDYVSSLQAPSGGNDPLRVAEVDPVCDAKGLVALSSRGCHQPPFATRRTGHRGSDDSPVQVPSSTAFPVCRCKCAPPADRPRRYHHITAVSPAYAA